MMAGTVVIEKNAGSTLAQLLEVVTSCVEDQLALGLVLTKRVDHNRWWGHWGSFRLLMQRGRMIVCGNAGKNLGDSKGDGTIFVGGEIKSLGLTP